MSKENYQKQLDSLLENLKKKEGLSLCDQTSNQGLSPSLPHRPSLLLHACCGPCSSYVLEYLSDFFDITVFYYNPNIYPEEEYYRRLNELKTFYTKFPPVLKNKIKVVEADYNPHDFYQSIDVQHETQLAFEKEKGERCRRCYLFRLKKSFEFAKENNFDYFCTTLSISPFKDADKINQIGNNLESEYIKSLENTDKAPKWLPSDFKKKNGFKRSLELSEKYNLYRQQYCGCVYSANNRR